MYRSGKMGALTTIDIENSGIVESPGADAAPLPFMRIERRLPGFFRLDFLIAYRWQTHWGSMRLALEWLNTTLSREAIGLKPCQRSPFGALPDELICGVEYTPRIFVPNLGLRGEF